MPFSPLPKYLVIAATATALLAGPAALANTIAPAQVQLSGIPGQPVIPGSAGPQRSERHRPGRHRVGRDSSSCAGQWTQCQYHIYSFLGQTTNPNDGWYGYGPLAWDGASTLYGTTYYGGASGQGTVFSITAPGSVLANTDTIIHSFQGTNRNMPNDGELPTSGISYIPQGNNKHYLWGTTTQGGTSGTSCFGVGCGTVFKMTLAGAEGTPPSNASWEYSIPSSGVYSGMRPTARMTQVGNDFVGTTEYGGTGTCAGGMGCGTVFKMNKTGVIVWVKSFQGPPNGTPNGAFPAAGVTVVTVNNTQYLYGTTSAGGSSTNSLCTGGCGTVFRLKASSGASFATQVSFQGQGCTPSCANGAYPAAGLTDLSGVLYGTTYQGGTSTNCTGGCGTLFSMTSPYTTETDLHDFGAANDGVGPTEDLAMVGGTPSHLYGTTQYGGAYENTFACGAAGCGTVFQYEVGGIGYQVINNFAGYPGDGTTPEGVAVGPGPTNYPLVYGLYGVTVAGGANSYGVVWGMTPCVGSQC
jgi:uncharacterized repeat protein (TIGR03803 family)